MQRLLALLLLASPLAGCLGGGPAPQASPPELAAPPLCQLPCDLAVAAKPWIEYEPSVAINPKDPRNILVGVHDDPLGASPYFVADPVTGIPPVLGPGVFLLSAQVTKDGGETWHHSFLPYLTKAEPGSQWNLFCNMGDPVVLFGPDGTAYYVGLGVGCTDVFFAAAMSYLFVAKSTDGGLTWGEPTIVWQAPALVQFEDKEWAALDPETGALAISWTAFTGGVPVVPSAIELYVSVSRDGGATWSTTPSTVVRAFPVQAPPVATEAPINYFSVPAWGKDGALHVAFWTCNGECIKVATTRDDGKTWAIVKASDVKHEDREGARATFLEYPVLDADRSGGAHDGRLYVSHQTAPEGDYDVVLAWSDDGGATWSPPIRLNGNAAKDGTDQFHHWMDVDERGVVHAMFFDRRNDPQNVLLQTTYARFDPATGALSNTLLTEPWTPDPGATKSANYGHYEAIAATGGTVFAAWTQATEPKPDQEPLSKAGNVDVDIRGARLVRQEP